jgi:hypothetical protein
MSFLKQRGLYNGKLVLSRSVTITCIGTGLYDQVDLYLANIPEQVSEMKQLGVKQPIVVCGITLQPLVKADPTEVKQKLGLPEGKKIILVSSGSLGIGFPA